MKRILFILSVAVLISTKGLCNELPVPNSVYSSFNTKFTGAQSIQWLFQNKLFRVEFEMNGQHYFAFYSLTGQLKGVGRNIRVDHLPLLVQMNLKQRFQNKWLSCLYELEENNSVYYYAILENANTKYYYKSGPNYSWHCYMKKMKQ